MIAEIRVHPAINQLVNNPLMLTAICILYHDDKELPGQRAELYKKFIDNMLYRRFPESEKVYTYLKKLAFTMHTGRVRGRDKSLCIETLSDVYTRNKGEKKDDYKKRLIQVFDDIESKCGLLKIEGGEYLFWHLSFQEFLTALYTVDNSRDYSEAINTYWEDDWHKEVIDLYLGYLSIDNKTWANGILSDTINAEDKHPFKKWFLAAESLVDIHKDRREPDVEEKAKQCLMRIIETEIDPKILFQAGESLGWLGDIRNLEAFVPKEAGKYNLEELGEVDIKPFEIGQYPVTNDWYARFIKEDGYKNEAYWSDEGKKWLKKKGQKQPGFWDYHKWKCPNSPVIGVCWYEADAFCRWLTLRNSDGHIYRLPTEQEWQAAAAGKEARKYPWGNDWDKNRCNNRETGIGKTSPVGIFKKGRTPEGAYDLSGNVWEWTSSDYVKKLNKADFKLNGKEYPILRGGSWLSYTVYCRCLIRYFVNPFDSTNLFGFRCART
jgi:formylglycine-generating enzyme required for sulfatase activity